MISSLVDATIRQISAYVKSLPELGPARTGSTTKLKALESRQRQVAAATELQNGCRTRSDDCADRARNAREGGSRRATSLKSAVGDVWKSHEAAVAHK